MCAIENEATQVWVDIDIHLIGMFCGSKRRLTNRRIQEIRLVDIRTHRLLSPGQPHRSYRGARYRSMALCQLIGCTGSPGTSAIPSPWRS